METDESQNIDAIGAPDEGAQVESAEDLAGFVANDVEPDSAPSVSDIPDFDPMSSDIDDDELKLDGFYEGLNEDHIKDLPTTAKRMLHNFRTASKLREQDMARKYSEKEHSHTERMEALGKLERDFARRQAEIAAMSTDPDVQKILNPPRSARPLDPYTPEGLEAMVAQRVADSMKKVLEPMNQRAEMTQRESALIDFVSDHPEMRDSTFKKEVVSMVKERWDGAHRVSTQDAYQLVKARRVLAQQQARQQQEVTARAKSARQVARRTTSGSPASDSIPKDVKRRGAGAIVNWLRDNPEAAKRLRSQNS
tara:strand:+ start:1551 stop:2477 length:927 start_codon:yes stop_codon:yes gene_type:complete